MNAHKLATAIVVWLVATTALATSTAELYSSRPTIESIRGKVDPQQYSRLTDDMKHGMLAYIAELNAFHPDGEFYFLARDGEYLYDMARLLYADDPSALKGFHLINVSRRNQDDPNLASYLKQEGLSKSRLGTKQAIFIDTGFAGSIPARINAVIGPELAKQTSTYMIVSTNPNVPSARVFLQHLDAAESKLNPSKMGHKIGNYEDLPHFTESASEFQKIDNRWVPVSYDQDPHDTKRALGIMAEIKGWTTQKEIRKLYFELYGDMRLLVEMAQGIRPFNAAIYEKTIARLKTNNADQFLLDLDLAVTTKMLKVDPDRLLAMRSAAPDFARIKDTLAKDSPGLKSDVRFQEDTTKFFAGSPESLKLLDAGERARFLDLIAKSGNLTQHDLLLQALKESALVNDYLIYATLTLKNNPNNLIRQTIHDRVSTDIFLSIKDADRNIVTAYSTLLSEYIEENPAAVRIMHYINVVRATDAENPKHQQRLESWLGANADPKLKNDMFYALESNRVPKDMVPVKHLQKIALLGNPEDAMRALTTLFWLEEGHNAPGKYVKKQMAERLLANPDLFAEFMKRSATHKADTLLFKQLAITKEEYAKAVSRFFPKPGKHDVARIVINAFKQPDHWTSQLVLDFDGAEALLNEAFVKNPEEFVRAAIRGEAKNLRLRELLYESLMLESVPDNLKLGAIGALRLKPLPASSLPFYEKLVSTYKTAPNAELREGYSLLFKDAQLAWPDEFAKSEVIASSAVLPRSEKKPLPKITDPFAEFEKKAVNGDDGKRALAKMHELFDSKKTEDAFRSAYLAKQFEKTYTSYKAQLPAGKLCGMGFKAFTGLVADLNHFLVLNPRIAELGLIALTGTATLSAAIAAANGYLDDDKIDACYAKKGHYIPATGECLCFMAHKNKITSSKDVFCEEAWAP